MALQPYDVQANSKLDIGGSEGHVLQTDSLLTYVGREDGTVSIYQTYWVYENASVVQPKNVQTAPDDPQASRIAELEAQLAERTGASSPEAVPPTGVTAEPITAPVTAPSTESNPTVTPPPANPPETGREQA